MIDVPFEVAGAEKTLVEKALRELEARFVSLELVPGSVWTELSLSELLGIGRTPVREAVALMAADGLVKVIRRAGIVISEISIDDQLAVLDARRVLERLVSVRAAVRCTDRERQHLRKLAEAIEMAGREKRVHAYLARHFEIKRFVAHCGRNKFAEKALRPLHTFSQRFYFAHHRSLNNLEEVGPGHARLTRAIAEGHEAEASLLSDEVNEIALRFTSSLLHRFAT